MTETTIQRPRPDPFDEILTAAGHLLCWAVVAAGTVVWWLLLFPMFSVPVAATAWLYVWAGWPAALGAGLASVAGLGWWALRWPASFRRCTVRRARARWLSWFRYRRQWAARLTACSLTRADRDAVSVPRLLGVEVGESTDRVLVRMLAGQCPDDWSNRTAHLAHAFGAQECRALITGPARVELVFRHRDSLADPIPVTFAHIPGGLGGAPRLPDSDAA